MLVPLLPIGMHLSTESPLYYLFIILHLGILLYTLLGATKSVLSLLAQESTIYRVSFTSIFSLATLYIVLQALLPVTVTDALIHHIAVPNWWARENYISEIPWHNWSYYPPLIHLAITGLFELGLGNYAALYHACYLFIFCGILAHFVRWKTDENKVALITYLVALTLPIAFRLATSPLVDLPLALFFGIAFVLAIYSVEEGVSTKLILLVGMALGLAFSTKYNSLPGMLAFVFGMIVFTIRRGQSPKNVIINTATISIVALLISTAWLYRNFELTGNPIYPLFQNLFPLKHDVLSGLPDLKPIEKRMLYYGESFFDLVLIPVRMIFFGQDHQPRHFDGTLSPLLVFLFLPLLQIRKRPWIMFSFIFSGFYFVITLFEAGARIRYLTPIALPLFSLAAVGLFSFLLFIKNQRVRNISLLFLLVAHFGLAAKYCSNELKQSETLTYFTTNQTKEDYLRHKISVYPMIELVNKALPPNSKTYLVYTGNRFFYYKNEVLGGYHSGALIINSLKNGIPLEKAFREAGVTHMLAHKARLLSVLKTQLNDQEKINWDIFLARHLQTIKEDSTFILWKVNVLESI